MGFSDWGANMSVSVCFGQFQLNTVTLAYPVGSSIVIPLGPEYESSHKR